MADRILVWTPTTHDAVFYLEEDYSPANLRILATVPPTKGDLLIDILDDGVTIMQKGTISTPIRVLTNAEIYYGTHDGDFQDEENVTGGDSGAVGKIVLREHGKLVLERHSSVAFTIGETITGSESTDTATIDGYVPPTETYPVTTKERPSEAMLEEGESINAEAEDFGDERSTMLEGSLITLSIPQYGGANGITVQLELEKTQD